MAPSGDIGKKRKRHTDSSSKPSKRVAIDEDAEVKISVRESDAWAPVFASTPGLFIPKSVALKPYVRSRPTSNKATSKSEIAAKELLLRSEDDFKLQYTAKEEEADEVGPDAEGAESYLKHYVGVYDPDTGKLEVMEARSMVVRGTVQAHQPPAEDLVAMNHREQKNALGEAFGTKKAKKAILSVTENAIAPQSSRDAPVKLNSSASAMLANMSQATAGMATKAELDATINANKPRPIANTETSDISQVYPVEVLIPTEALAAIQVRSWQTAMNAQQDVKVASRFVANRLLKFKDNVTKLKMLRYALLLIEFYNAAIPGKFGRKIKRPEDLKLILNGQPESLLQGIKRKFSDGPMMTRHQADLLITHICAIALVLENYEVDTWDLKEDLKLDVNPMTQYFKEVGARVGSMPDGVRKSLGIDKAAAAQRRIAKLKIPLEFPATKFVRAGRR